MLLDEEVVVVVGSGDEVLVLILVVVIDVMLVLVCVVIMGIEFVLGLNGVDVDVGGGVAVAIHKPSQVSVCVHMAPTGHGDPPRTHVWVAGPPLGAVVRQSPQQVMV